MQLFRERFCVFHTKMWNFSSKSTAGNSKSAVVDEKLIRDPSECSDDEVSSNVSREEGLDCPICYESFNIVENVPYVLWCGHTLCKNCVLGLQRAVVKFPTLPIQLPLFISCPWCHLLSLRLVYKGNLKFPRKNFFILWMVESMNGDRVKSHSFSVNNQPVWPPNGVFAAGGYHSTRSVRENEEVSRRYQEHGNLLVNYLNVDRIHASLRKSLVFFAQITAKLPLVLIFLLIVLYVIPASAVILVLYILVTILFGLPSFLILYFAYPSLDWLVREIIAR